VLASQRPTDDSVVNAIRHGDEPAFTAVVQRYRHQLHVHCYRMLGSFDDAEDLVQETLLRAWRARETFEGRSLVRTWLYRIATNVCLNALERAPRRVLPQDVAPPVTVETDAGEARSTPTWAPETPWLQPYPDSLLELALAPAPTETEPESMAVSRESIELTFLAALQHLPPRQRAILLLRDVVEWSAKETARALEMSVASVNSAHQRARATLRALRPVGRSDVAVSPVAVTAADRAALAAFMDAWERADTAALASLLREDARWAMPPAPLWFDGRAAIVRLYTLFPIDFQGRQFRMRASGANRQPAAAAYVRGVGETRFSLAALHVLRVERGLIAEVTTFSPEMCGAFGDLPATLDLLD
jgi:RNA polymerase sigma-70 factor (ECF subfamily)